MASSSSTRTGWKRRSSAGSPRSHLSHSLAAGAPMIRISPRTDPGFPDEGGIVLALTQQNVHHARDLGVATAHRLQVTAPRLRGEIHTHALEHFTRVEQPFERIAHSGQAAPRNRRYQS